MGLHRAFFERDTTEVASSLIGKSLVKYTNFFGQIFRLSGIITETEAYGYNNDPASHAYKGTTKRNKAMFGNIGIAYVYFIYGNHYCLNIVAKEINCPAGAVLIRSIDPKEGLGIMRISRNVMEDSKLTTGPGRLTQAFGITKKHDKIDLVRGVNNNYFYVEENKFNKDFTVGESARIGITAGSDKKWRFTMFSKEPGYSEYVPSKFLSRSS